jgi:hypothetical protein
MRFTSEVASGPGAGPMSGDLVRARTSDRDAVVVEGVLHLRYVPMLHYVQVAVDVGDLSHAVDPVSVEVLTRGVVDPDFMDLRDPVFDTPGWHAEHDLEQAVAHGMVTAERVREGGSWQDLFDRLTEAVQPLVDAGWSRTGSFHRDSWEYGDDVSYMLQRGDTEIEIQYYEYGRFDVFPSDDPIGGDDDPEPTPLLFRAETRAELDAEFTQRGWR